MRRDQLPSGFSGMPCVSCTTISAPLTDADFADYFRGGLWTPSACNHSVSLWRAVRAAVGSDHALMPGAVAISVAKLSFGELTLKRKETVNLDLHHIGVPEGARILGVFLTPHGGNEEDGWLAPAISAQSFTTAPIPHQFWLHGFAAQGGSDSTNVNVLCSWVDPVSDPELLPLWSAVEAYTAGSYQDVIVPASVAVESKLGSVLHAHFRQFAGREKVERFLQDAATFSYQLSPLLPAVMSGTGAPELPEEVAGMLSWLRNIRNKVAHSHAAVSREQAADAVCASLFGFRYLASYGPLVAPSQT
ncbi:hypothetical protein AB0D32_29615 [Micromonospora sp. NPDC048170]|uniref:hypothetical protein n=1 Tax=Micromonospora sp. NPDC048170 TaxID=3154819 RepID=UPI0033CF9B12